MKHKVSLFVLFLSLCGIYALEQITLHAQENCINCQECCSKGRMGITRECCIQCNGCTLYGDEAKAECGDFPY